MASRRSSPTPRKPVAIKNIDGEPLTRVDIQYDLLHAIFTDTQRVFTNPYPPANSTLPNAKICFRDLYISAVLNSPKATKVLKDKMTDSELFAEDFAMLALLVNVGRINTTMSFFPEMKTTIRTYHPVPALQRTVGNLQDAPRIKHILKTSLLEHESKNPPSSVTEIASRLKIGHIPSTSITNLIFAMANHSASIGQAHFSDTLDFIDLFLRKDISSSSRARAFLWLCFNYLESYLTNSEDDYDDDNLANPFCDPRKHGAPGFILLTSPEIAVENVDPQEEQLLAEQLISQRNQILRTQSVKDNNKTSSKASVSGSVVGDDEDLGIFSGEEVKGKGKRGSTRSSEKPKRTLSSAAKEKKAAADKARRERLKQKSKDPDSFVAAPESGLSDGDMDAPINSKHDIPRRKRTSQIVMPLQNQYPQLPRVEPPQQVFASHNISQPYSHFGLSPSPELSPRPRRDRYSPYTRSPVIGPKDSRPRSHHILRVPIPSRTLLQHAWHVVNTTDPLLDSDDEQGDEHVRHDYIQRLKIISRLRGKPPTPEPGRVAA